MADSSSVTKLKMYLATHITLNVLMVGSVLLAFGAGVLLLPDYVQQASSERARDVECTQQVAGDFDVLSSAWVDKTQEASAFLLKRWAAPLARSSIWSFETRPFFTPSFQKSLRSPKTLPLAQAEVTALLMDRDFDSLPDVAALFIADDQYQQWAKLPNVLSKGLIAKKHAGSWVVEVDLPREKWGQQDACGIWKYPALEFARWAKEEFSWTPEIAKGHEASFWLSQLRDYELRADGIKIARAGGSSVSIVDKETAMVLFEALATYVHLNSSEISLSELSTTQFVDLLNVMHVFTGQSEIHGKLSLRVEGLKQHLLVTGYKAPVILVKEPGAPLGRAYVLDPLLFNSIVPLEDWRNRVLSAR